MSLKQGEKSEKNRRVPFVGFSCVQWCHWDSRAVIPR